MTEGQEEFLKILRAQRSTIDVCDACASTTRDLAAEVLRGGLPRREDLERERFTYAEVPYEYRPWADIVANPRDTIRFDEARHARVEERVRELGSDGRLLRRRAEFPPGTRFTLTIADGTVAARTEET